MESNIQEKENNKVTVKNINKESKKVVPIWRSQLDRFESGKIKNSLNNFKLILENDERFKGKIRLNEFTLRTMMKTKKGYKNIDDNIITNLLYLIEKDYDGINKRDFIEKVIDTVGEENKFHPIVDYLEGLKWDGQKRIATAFSDYFGCEASEYNEYCLRTFLNGAIARVLHPGIKFDYMLILYGDQGQGKSTFFRYLCGKDEYYQDNLDKFEGEKAFEKTENKWIVEAAELTFMSKSTTEQVKSFITARKDTIRFKYKKYSNDIYRQFVMLGTTNNVEFLTDKTGNRRFLIVNVKKENEPIKNLFGDYKEVQADMEQIMAEAYHDYKQGMDFLVMPERFNEEILLMQGAHLIDDEKKGMIEQYLENVIEEKRKTDERFGTRNYYCCVGQILHEALGYRKNDKIPRTERNDVALIMNDNKKWIKCKNSQRVNTAMSNDYGSQKAYQYNYKEDEVLKAREERFKKQEEEEKETITNNINNITNQELDYDDYFMKL